MINWERVLFLALLGSILVILLFGTGCGPRTVVIRPATPEEAVEIARDRGDCLSLWDKKRVVVTAADEGRWGLARGEFSSLLTVLENEARTYGMVPIAAPLPAHDVRIEASVTSSDAYHYRVDLRLVEISTGRVLSNGTGAAWYSRNTYGSRYYHGLGGRIKPTRLEAVRSAAEDAAKHLLCVKVK